MFNNLKGSGKGVEGTFVITGGNSLGSFVLSLSLPLILNS